MMKIGRILVVIAALLVCIMAATPSSALTYNDSWRANDQDMIAVQVSNGSGVGGMYMYDYNAPSLPGLLLVSDTLGSSATINFANVNGNWIASTSGGSLNLGSTEEFGFYFTDLFGTKIWSYDLNVLAPGDTYELSAAGLDVIVHDATVPEPTTMLLLGSGLLGCVFFGRRQKKV